MAESKITATAVQNSTKMHRTFRAQGNIMQGYHDKLKELILYWENEVVEFKQAGKDFSTDSIAKYFSALANEARLRGYERAYLIFGVNDKTREIVGTDYRLNDTKQPLDKIKHQIYEKTSPKISFIEVVELYESNKRVILFIIPAAPKNQPVASSGHYYARAGESLVALSFDKLDRLRGLNIEDWSSQIVEGASFDDLDPMAIQTALEKFFEKYPALSQEAQSWSNETFLNKAKITIKGKITHSALLLLGKAESAHFLMPAYPRITWILKDKDGIEKDYEHFDPPFLLQVEKVFNKIRQLKYRYTRTDSIFPEEVDQYEPYVIREALHNAIAHQDYTQGGKITLVEFEDGRLVFSNYGEFIPKTIENVIHNNAPESYYRNQWLASAMVNIKMIDTIGSGIRKMFLTQKERFFPLPEYELANNKVEVTITGRVLDLAYARKLAQNPSLSLEDIMLLDNVQKKKALTTEQIKYLKKLNLIEGRKPHYYISKDLAILSGEEANYTHSKAFEDQHYKELILRCLKDFNGLPRKKINEIIFTKLPDILDSTQKQNKVKNLLQALKKEGKITLEQRTWKAV